MKSVIQNEERCIVCGSWNIKDYPIFFGTDEEELCDDYGLKVWLCPTHYKKQQEKTKLDMELKQLGQKAFEWRYARKHFIQLFKNNYLGE